MLIEMITRQREPPGIRPLVALLKAGRSPRPDPSTRSRWPRAEVILGGRDNPEQLLDVASTAMSTATRLGGSALTIRRAPAAAFRSVRGDRLHQPGGGPSTRPTRRTIGRKAITPSGAPGAESWSSRQLLERLDAALLGAQARRGGFAPDRGLFWKAGFDRAPLVQCWPPRACKLGRTDPHNQELGLLPVGGTSSTPRASDRDRLLLASAQHTAGTASTATRWRPTGAHRGIGTEHGVVRSIAGVRHGRARRFGT